jgi:uncharacterized protein YdcH (DUF465 family)
MEITQEDLKAHLMQTNEEYRQLAAQHAELKKRVMELEENPHPTPEQQLEEAQLKKLKLQIKDQMTEIINRSNVAA